MKPIPSISFALWTAFAATVAGQTPAPGDAPAPTVMQKWIADVDAQWEATFKREVANVHEAELEKLKVQFLTSLQTEINKASSAGNLENALALRKEQRRFSEANEVPARDDVADPGVVTQLRAGCRKQLAQIEKEHAGRARALHARYDQLLSQTQTQLTQHARLDDAVLVKAKRDEVAAQWVPNLTIPDLPPVAGEPPKPEPANPAMSAVPRTPRRATPYFGGFEQERPISPGDVAAKTAGDSLWVKGKVRKAHPTTLSAQDRFYVEMESGVVCELFVRDFKGGVAFNLTGVFAGTGNSRAQILRPGTDLIVVGRYDGRGTAGLAKGHMLRDCKIASEDYLPFELRNRVKNGTQ